METNYVNLEVVKNIAIITLNRPNVLNALNKELTSELEKVCEEILVDKNIRVVIIKGSGKHFAAGADITDMVNMIPSEARDFSFKETFKKISELPQPVIAAVDGYALGGGFELVLATDITIASKRAKFGLPEITLGIMPGAGGTQRLPRIIGMRKAMELIMTGDIIDSTTAYELGLVNRLVEADSLMDAALELANRIAGMPPLAVNAAKHTIRHGSDMDINNAIEIEAVSWANLFSTQDQKEGMRAFLEKRKPEFTGK